MEMLVEPTGAIELLPHAIATPLTHTVPMGQATHPTAPKLPFEASAVGGITKPPRQKQPPERLPAPGAEKVFGGQSTAATPPVQ